MAAPSEELLDVVVGLLAEHGFEGLSIRRVAARAGVSIGAVQHHYPTKDALLAAAMRRVDDQVSAELAGRVQRARTPGEALRAVSEGLVPAGPEERPAAVVWLAQVARAAVHEPTAVGYRASWQRVEDALSRLIAAARPGLRAEQVRDEAAVLLALLDGLATARVAEPDRVTGDRARRLVGRHLDALLTPTGDRT
ncbi:TetR/AcrR family transcriptional regulator [Pseudokineococcus marinus]|uniref:TetR family transcriptional regulator n=1 Tax=Pseudokineococcus marinus TaxID=351215 RepID=A0A849BLA1_9ACTN|nr:TetR/AcrR family transcriptional regulator [Pseudokineococcus marinus]NNH23431.1 TetR family transcriptional regulator [Pseudokineococcus marinus]